MKAASGITLTLLLIGILALAFRIQPVKAEPGTITVPDDYPTIQDAINAANPGDTIFVHPGIYYEHIIVNKTVSLIGENKDNTIIDGGGAGHIICVTVNDSVISGFTLRDGYNYGVHLHEGTKGNIVSGNTIIRCCVGINSDQSHGNTVRENTVEDCDCGILLWYSDGNIVNGNILEYDYHGISISYSDDNTVGGNKLTRNSLGVYLWCSDDNTLGNNSFISNTNQVYITTGYINQWDGNYWSDHNPPDIYSGPYQNETGRDGIGDIPYIMDGNNTDRYPLIYPYGYIPSPDLNGDGTIDIMDVVIAAVAFGTEPGNPKWNPIADLNNDGLTDIFDFMVVAAHFGESI